MCGLMVCAAPLSAQSVLTFPRVIADTGLFTGIAVSNPTTTSVAVTFTAYQANGTLVTGTGVKNPVVLNVPAGGQVAKQYQEIFGGSAAFNGWVQATSNTSGLTGFFLNGNSALTDLDGAESTTASP